GVHTTFAQVAGAAVGVDPSSVVVEQTDTGKVANGTGSFQSRSSVVAATSAHRAAKQLRAEILEAAAWRLDHPPERLSIGGGDVTIDGRPSGVTLAQLATADPADNGGHRLDVSVTYDPVQASHPYGPHGCMREIESGSGPAQARPVVVSAGW